MMDILDDSPGTVHFIEDFLSSHEFPTGLTLELLQHTGLSGPLTHERMGLLVLVMSSLIHRTGFSLFQKVFPKYRHKVVRVDTSTKPTLCWLKCSATARNPSTPLGRDWAASDIAERWFPPRRQ
jgi:hypothetical protein